MRTDLHVPEALRMAPTAIESRKLYQKVANAIAAAISEGRYHPGQRLPPERELAEEFEVSRPTVREAMLALEIRGLVEPRHGSGIYVRQAEEELETSDLDIGAFELTEARALLEGEVAALAATTIGEEELSELQKIILQMEHDNAGDLKEEEADRRFHLTIAAATRNVALAYVVETLWDMRTKSPLCRHMLERARDAGSKPRIEEHQKILDALKVRDPVAARQAMRDHLARVVDYLLAATESEAVERARTEIAAKRKEYARRWAI